jgi:hypothetical protein
MSFLSINGNMWLCIVVDDVSRLPFLFFMKDKNDIATYIKECENGQYTATRWSQSAADAF